MLLVHLAAALTFAPFCLGTSIEDFTACWEQGGNVKKLITPKPNETEYLELHKQWNLRWTTVWPAGYLLPTTTSDVALAVKCAKNNGFRVAVSSGGHCYEGISRGVNESIVLDMREMTDLTFKDGPTVVAQPGVLLGHLNGQLWEKAKYAVVFGNCPTVALGGLAVGGGMGVYSSSYGLTIDHVLGYTMVNAKGEIVVADKDTNPELFWGLRGMGPGGLGIVTDVTLQLTDASGFKMTLWVARFKVEDWPEVMVRYQNLLKWLHENQVTASCELFVAKKPTVEPTPRVPAIYNGVTIRCVHTEDPVLFPTPWSPEMSEVFVNTLKPEDGSWFNFSATYIKVVGEFSFHPPQPLDYPTVEGGMNTPFDSLSDEEIIAKLGAFKKGEDDPSFMKSKGFFVSEAFTADQFKDLGELLTNMPFNVSLYLSPFNGAIWNVTKDATAFAHRDSFYLLSVEYSGPSDADNGNGMDWLYKFYNAANLFMSNGGVYQNFPDLDVKDYESAFYRGNLGRMLALKKQWDEFNYFENPLSIRFEK